MNALGEKDYDYEFFAGLTRRCIRSNFFIQYFPRRWGNRLRAQRSVGLLFVEEIFSKCGYASAFVQEEQLKADKEKYLQLLLSYIDKGIPVISNLRIMGHQNGLFSWAMKKTENAFYL